MAHSFRCARLRPALFLAALAFLLALGIGSSVPCLAFVPRTGFVTLQFDDTHEYDYSRIFPKLEECGLKGSFGYITEVSALGIEHDATKIVEMYEAGHEIQDHTTRHDYMWSTHVDTLNDGVTEWLSLPIASPAQWDSLCQRSYDILDSLGIHTHGWNQPGGGNPVGTIPGHPSWAAKRDTCYVLYDIVSRYYSYAIAAGVWANTAHLNLRGHNCPDRFPFFSVPYTTLDDRDLSVSKRDIADAVASGLWYVALFHPAELAHVEKAESLIDWIEEKDIEVLTCSQGVQRVQWGSPDPAENQLPQGAMLRDLDGNGKPDGFTGSCAWDTITPPPVEGVRCMQVTGGGLVDFFCYGPQTGTSGFSMWIKSPTGAPVEAAVIFSKMDFDWNSVGDTWTLVSCGSGWIKVDSLYSQNFSVDVADEVDRILIRIVSRTADGILVADPRLTPVLGPASVPEVPGGPPGQANGLVLSPSPVRAGAPLRITTDGSAATIEIYDILGRLLLVAHGRPGDRWATVDTKALPPGVLFARDRSNGATAKFVVCK